MRSRESGLKLFVNRLPHLICLGYCTTVQVVIWFTSDPRIQRLIKDAASPVEMVLSCQTTIICHLPISESVGGNAENVTMPSAKLHGPRTFGLSSTDDVGHLRGWLEASGAS